MEELLEHGGGINIKNCSNNGYVHSVGNYSNGGILGFHRDGALNITNCFNETKIGENSAGYSGGIVGQYTGVDYNSDRTLNIYNCYNTGNILGENYCGGILGYQGLTAKTITLNVENCYNIGEVEGKYPGGIVGILKDSDSRTTAKTSIKNTYWLSTVASKAIYSGNCTDEEIITQYDMEYMKSNDFCDILNNNIGENTEWKEWILGDDGYPTLEE